MDGGTLQNPYSNCHSILFNISDEYWDIIEKEYLKFKSGSKYKFPKKPFGDDIMSPEHKKALAKCFKDLWNHREELF
jgi:hypothetical protein